MSQGLKNAPAISLRGMTIVLKGLVNNICIVYIDYILIFEKSKEEHDKNLKTVYDRLERYGFEFNTEKSIICTESVEFLGFKISLNTLEPLSKRSKGIENFSIPRTKRKLRRFLGLLNYDRVFISNLSHSIKPLYEILSREGNSLVWNEDDAIIFNKVRKLWCNNL